MTLPNAGVTIEDGGLGAIPSQESDLVIVLGCSSSGTALVVSQQYSRAANLQADYGDGPGVEDGAFLLDAGIPVVFIKLPSNTPGTFGSVTHSGTGGSVLTLTGSVPYDDNEVIVEWLQDGTIGTDTPRFQYSLDGGISQSDAVRMGTPGTYTIPHTNIALTFSASTVKTGDTYSFSTTGPRWANSDITTALANLAAKNQLLWRLIHLVGPTNETSAAVVDQAMQSMSAAFRYTRTICDSVGFGNQTESQWMTTLENDFATFSSIDGRVLVGAGPTRIASSFPGSWRRIRSVAWLAVRRAMQLTIHADISIIVPLEGINDVTGHTVVYHDEEVLGGLDDARFITIRSIAGRVGYFIGNPNAMAPVGSDFTLLQLGLVADLGCATIRQYFLTALNTPVRLEIGTPHILEKDRQTLQQGGQRAMFDALVSKGHCTATQTVVAADDDLTVPPRVLTVDEFIQPLGYIKGINIRFQFKSTIQ